MSLTRRHMMLSAVAAAGAAGTLRLTTGPALAHNHAGETAQAPAFQRMRVGDMTVTALSDGHLSLGPQVFPDVSEAQFAEAMNAAFLPADAYTAPVNAYLVESADRTILIDAGATSAMAPTAGELETNLEAAGVSADSVDSILITHMHPDHVGHLTMDGGARFPNAEVVVREEEIAFWGNPETRAAMPDDFKPMVDAANAAVEPYAERIRRITSDETVAPGIDAHFLPGHTPGHTGFRVSSGDAQLLIWGDIVHVAPVQMANPRVFIGFDVTPETAVETRLRLLDEAATDRLMVAGMHMPFPGFGHIRAAGEGYEFVRADWQYTL